MLSVPLIRLPHGEGLPLPSYGTALSAGLDLSAASASQVLVPLERALIPTGFAIALPEGFEAQIRSRSGLAWKNGLVVLNSPGTIDADYRGELKVILINLGSEVFEITRGMRIAQIVIAPVSHVRLEESRILPEALSRGEGGFGSTGV